MRKRRPTRSAKIKREIRRIMRRVDKLSRELDDRGMGGTSHALDGATDDLGSALGLWNNAIKF